ncbi:MAG: uracil-DNA glycosylase family protein [Acidimicrobiia bacterium]|nr:MAG: uracil-DNA glycosylase family protein [Acidimicrobiia bacterium]
MSNGARNDELARLSVSIAGCARCPRLVEWRELVAREKRAAFADDEYWGRPVPGFGDPEARLVVVGLAPAAHGANRTGRMFTGDRSGDWLYRAMYRAGFASQPTSTDADDGLTLSGAWVTAPVRCAPPANKPTTEERDNCRSWFDAELDLLDPAVFVALGDYAYRSVWRYLADRGLSMPRPRPAFAHGGEVTISDDLVVIASYHPSQQNTFTGKLTEPMLDAVFSRASELAR